MLIFLPLFKKKKWMLLLSVSLKTLLCREILCVHWSSTRKMFMLSIVFLKLCRVSWCPTQIFKKCVKIQAPLHSGDFKKIYLHDRDSRFFSQYRFNFIIWKDFLVNGNFHLVIKTNLFQSINDMTDPAVLSSTIVGEFCHRSSPWVVLEIW